MDIPRLYTAIAEVVACGLYWFIMPRRCKTAEFVLWTAVFFVLDAGWLILTDNVPIVFWVPCMVVAVLMMMGYLFMITRTEHLINVYTTLKALLVAEFMASLEWQLEYYGIVYFGIDKRWGWVWVPVIYGITAFVIWHTEKAMHAGEMRMEIGTKEIGAPLLIAIASFAASNLSFIAPNTPFSANLTVDVFNIRTMVDLAGIAFFFAYQSRILELTAERELASINTMLKAQYDHYRNYQETINLINIKYHDLKHQLAGLRSETDPEKRAAWIDTLSAELEQYKPETQTGNQVLDGILDQKMPMIRKNGIKFTCVADGKILAFMHVTDICTIFGNALDNAIENLIVNVEPERRLIHMSVSMHRQFVYISIANYCDHPVAIVDGFPLTTKQDKKNHGFGVKSIAYTAEKYGGSVNFGVDHDMFEIKILIPQQ